jgi:hypothetical protein
VAKLEYISSKVHTCRKPDTCPEHRASTASVDLTWGALAARGARAGQRQTDGKTTKNAANLMIVTAVIGRHGKDRYG